MAPRIDPTNEIRVMNKNSTRRLTRNVSKRVTESSPGLSSHKQAKQGSNDAIVEQLMGSAELLKKQNKIVLKKEGVDVRVLVFDDVLNNDSNSLYLTVL